MWQSHWRFHPRQGKRAVWMRCLEVAGVPPGQHGFKPKAFYQKNGSSDNLGNELPGDIGQTHVPAVVIVGKPFMVYP